MKQKLVILDNGLKINSLIAGENENPPLILLHGYPTNAFLWRKVIPFLSKKFKVYAPDLPGYGKSSKMTTYSYDLDFYTEFLNLYYKKFKIKQAHLTVHDLGGQIGLAFVSRFPQKVNKLIIMDCLAYKEWPKAMVQFANFAKSPFWSKFLRLKPVFSYQFFKDKNIVFDSSKIGKKIIQFYHHQWVKDPLSKSVFSRVFSASAEKLTEPRENLKKIKNQTLILWATNDHAMPVEIAANLNCDIRNSQLKLIPECGHFVPEEQPELILKYISGFLMNRPAVP